MKTGASILVADDQPDLCESLELTLSAAGYHVLTAHNGIEALAILQGHPIDLIVADIAMPQMNGYQLYERVRENPAWMVVPFLFLTARTLDSDVRYGKELGVDDYLTKPIQPEDLLAAVRGKLRRAQQLAHPVAELASTQPHAAGQRALSIGTLHIDPGQHRVWQDGQPIKLSAREFTLLEYLARRANILVSLKELIQVTHSYQTDQAEAGSLLRPLVRSLRRKLGYPAGEMGCIENVRGVGYRLIAPDPTE